MSGAGIWAEQEQRGRGVRGCVSSIGNRHPDEQHFTETEKGSLFSNGVWFRFSYRVAEKVCILIEVVMKYHRPHNTQQARASPQQSSVARHAYIPSASVTTALVREKDGLFITTSTSTLQLQRLDLPTR